MKSFTRLFALVFLAGCATNKPAILPTVQAIDLPPHNEVGTATLGDENLEKGKLYVERPVYMRTTAPKSEFGEAVFLVERKEAGEYKSHGSGFRVDFDGVIYCVTARHVVQTPGTNWGQWLELRQPLFIRMKPVSSNTPPERLHVEIGDQISYERLYSFHPDSMIDVAVFPSTATTNVLQGVTAFPFDYVQEDSRVTSGEDVYIFGFPGPYGFDKGEAVIRSGTIRYKLNRYIYLLDAHLWPGDSGGLIISKPYFGVPEDSKGAYQWNIGGKVLGIEQGLHRSPTNFFSVETARELQGFQVIFSGQAIKEVFESPAFKERHRVFRNLLRRQQQAPAK